jgi:hypothetical protein
MISIRARLAFLMAALIAISLAASPAQGQSVQDRLTLVELYASQGCPICPPATSFLGELAKRKSVMALTLHVDYWNYLGWEDTFASRATTGRQRAYATRFEQRGVYTPQMVVHGIGEQSGLRRDAIEAMIEDARRRPQLRITAELVAPDRLSVTIGAQTLQQFAEVFLAVFDERRSVHVRSGENAGRVLTTYNVVRELRRLGAFTGDALTLELDIAEGADAFDRCAIIVQSAGLGRVLGVARITLSR